MKRGSHGRCRPISSCTPIRMTNGPLMAPPTPGIGMKAGRVARNSNIPNERSPSPPNRSPSLSTSCGSPSAKESSRARVPASGGALPWSARCFIFVRVRFDALVQQQLVDARPVKVDHLDAPIVPVEIFAHVGDAPEVRDHHAGGGVEVMLLLVGQDAAAEQFAQVLDRQRSVEQEGAVGTLHDWAGVVDD